MANFNMSIKATNKTGENISELNVKAGLGSSLKTLINEPNLGSGASTPDADFSGEISEDDYTWDVSFTDKDGKTLSGSTTTPSPKADDDFKVGTVTIFADNTFTVQFPDGSESTGNLS